METHSIERPFLNFARQTPLSPQIFSGRAVFRQNPSFHTVCLIYARADRSALSMTSSNIEKVVDGLAFDYLSEGDI